MRSSRLGGAAVFLVLCALALAAGAAGRPGLAVGVVSVQARSSSASIGWRASGPARVVVEYGLDATYGVWSSPSGSARSTGTLDIGGLEPNTTYAFRVDAYGRPGRALATGRLTTGPIPAWTLARTTAQGLFLDWQPFFPRMVWEQCPWAYPQSLSAGVNLYLGSSCADATAQLADLSGRAFSAIPLGQRGIDGRGLVGWYQPDEPDEHTTPLALAVPPTQQQTDRVTFLTLGSHFFTATAPPAAGRGIYPTLIAESNMVGFDLYPLQGWCRWALQAVYQAQRQLVALAAGRPTYQWIEAAPMSHCTGLDPTPQTVRAETWLAIAGGARGIGWFPSEWSPPVGAEIGVLDRQIASLAPALLGREVPVVSSQTSPVKVGARSYHGATYVIAASASVGPHRVSFTVPGLPAGLLTVLGENRTIPTTGGKITDTFAGLGVHIYVSPPASSR
jgi:hypothetical protein